MKIILDYSKMTVSLKYKRDGWGNAKKTMSMEMGAKVYLDSFLSKGKTPLGIYDTPAASKVKNKSVAG